MYSVCCSKLVKGLNILKLTVGSHGTTSNFHSAVFQYMADFEGITEDQKNVLLFVI
jgi:hypothetical protein